MNKRKGRKNKQMICETSHRNLKIGKHEPHKSGGWPRCYGRVGIACSTSGISRVTITW